MTYIVQRRQMIFALCGILAPIIFCLMVIVESLMRPGYSPIHNFVSDLGVGSFAILQNINFMIFGLLTIFLGLGLNGSLPIPRRRSLKIGIWLVIIFGILIILAGVFPENYGSGALHQSVSAFAFLSIIAAQLLVWKGLKGGDFAIWGKYRTYSLVSGLLSIIFLILLQVAISDFPAYQGLAQRLFLAVPWIWVGVTGLVLYLMIRNNSNSIKKEKNRD
jgi:hypothetical membrane protein